MYNFILSIPCLCELGKWAECSREASPGLLQPLKACEHKVETKSVWCLLPLQGKLCMAKFNWSSVWNKKKNHKISETGFLKNETKRISEREKEEMRNATLQNWNRMINYFCLTEAKLENLCSPLLSTSGLWRCITILIHCVIQFEQLNEFTSCPLNRIFF